ncbi:MAG: PEP-CTERM sorting domain-containing protein [Pirellulales bacterium]|nr:PEP-CTERM sorting domain-containing protein [Pirellulales bacterium]
MRTFSGFVLFVATSLVIVATAAAQQIPLSRVAAHYNFEETSGAVFADTGAHTVDASYSRVTRFSELPAQDTMLVTSSGAVGSAIGLGTRSIWGTDHQMMIDIPASTALPAAGDSFAVSFWLQSDEFFASYGLLASYNLNGSEWSIGLNNGADVKGLLAWSGDADAAGNAEYSVNCDYDGADLYGGNFAHFVVQYEGAAGITNVFINGTNANSPDSGSTASYWGNEREGFVLGGRVLDARPFGVCSNNPVMDDFAIISGVVDATDVSNLYASGAASLDARRLAHYTMDDASGSQITDASANANHGTLVGYDPVSMGFAVRDVSSASRPGVFANSNCVEFANGFGPERAELATAENLPGHGEAFTVCFWTKPDENLAESSGWDQSGVIMNWSNDPTPETPGDDGLGFSIGQYAASDGAMIVRVTDGSATGDSSMYGVYLGDGGGSGLNLDPTVFHHFAVTVDENGDVTGMYVDGVNIAAHWVTSGWNVNDPNTATIGGRFVGGSYSTGYGGYLDDLAVFDGVLTEAQIAKIIATGVDSIVGSVPGDVDGDGYVSAADARILAANWLKPNATPEMGDLNGDYVVDDLDASIMAANWTGDPVESVGVPEPSLVVLMIGALLALGALRRRRAR